jgi:hypothetical protein
VQVGELAPDAAAARVERPLLEVPDERDAEVGLEHLVREGHRGPVEQRVDHVGAHAAHRLAPAVVRQVGHVAERQRADRVEPVRLGAPQAEQLVAALLEREHAVGVVGQLADEEDPQPVGRARRVGPGAVGAVLRDLVVQVALRAVEAQRLAHAVAARYGFRPPTGSRMTLWRWRGWSTQSHVTSPVATNAPRSRSRAHSIRSRSSVVSSPRSTQRSGPRRCSTWTSWQRLALDLPFGELALAVPHARVGERRVRVRVERGGQRREVARVEEVVGRQVGDVRAPRRVQADVQRGAQADVARPARRA